MHFLILLVALPSALWAGFVDEIGVDGPRPRVEIVEVLAAHRASIESCTAASGDAVRAIELDVLGAGYVDKVTIHDRNGDALDDACLTATLRKLPFVDRGREPSTRVLLHLFSGERGDVASFHDLMRAYEPQRDDAKKCVRRARELSRDLADQPMQIVLRFPVDPRGHVNKERVEVEAPRALDRECITTVVEHMVFEARPREREERAVFPLWFAPPSSPIDPRAKAGEPQAPTLFRFLGCM